ncbi:MAG: MmgE/PrpD family protein [Rhizobiaceae bacterium]|nr:MmgE/PrpD family protein [Rhizobiaceae bacterium]
MRETRHLTAFAHSLRFDDLPSEIIDYAKVFVLDNFASGFVGANQPWATIVGELAREAGSSEQCTVFGRSWRANPSHAALVNGVMIGAFEAEHAAPIGGHPSGNVFPPLLAIAERDRKDGKSFLTSFVLGYEVVCRIAQAATRAVEDERGYHTPATNGQFGAAIAVGKLLDFDELILANAMGIAGSHCAGLLEFVVEGAMTKRLHLGRAGQMGLESALLASRGFTGPTTILEGDHGYLRVFSTVYNPGQIIEGIGQDWLMQKQIFIKPYTCHGTQQAVVQALLGFLDENPIDPKNIEEIRVSGSRSMIHLHDNQEPTSIMGAQYSMPFIVAVALVGDITNPHTLNEKTLWDPAVREMAKKVATVIDGRFAATYSSEGPHAEIVIVENGKRHVVNATGFKGMPETPYGFADVADKILRYGTDVVGRSRVEEIIDKVQDLERLTDMADLASLIRA